MSGPLVGADETGRGLVAGTLRGYRMWHVLPRGVDLPPGTLPLASITRSQVAWTRAMSAACVGEDPTTPVPRATHAVPARECSCGIYAWYAPVDARTFSAEVFGVVDASGLVLMGTQGFRAERASITAIATRNKRVAAACADAGITVCRRRRDLVRAYPPDDVATVLGEAPSRSRPPHVLAFMIALAAWLRVILLVAVTGFMPLAGAIATVVVVQAVIVVLIVMHLRATPKHTIPVVPDP